MSEYIGIDLSNKDCKGMFLYCSTDLNKITTTSEANKLIGKVFKIQLRIRVDGVEKALLSADQRHEVEQYADMKIELIHKPASIRINKRKSFAQDEPTYIAA